MFKQLESAYCVGRQEELRTFEELLLHPGQGGTLLHLYGIGGIGKSCLLDRFQSVSAAHGALFIYIDSRDFTHTPKAFMDRLMELALNSGAPADRDGLAAVNRIAAIKPVVLALDTYERLTDLDHWLRESFMEDLHPNVLTVIAGRNPLSVSWSASPVWRARIKSMPLREFDYQQAAAYLHKFDITDENELRFYWNYTHGLPLALSLAAASAGSGSSSNRMKLIKPTEMIADLVQAWLDETSDEHIRDLVEAASLLSRFNQETLESIMGVPVTAKQFRSLTRLSFVKRSDRGWVFHDLVKSVIRQELKERTPDRYAYWARRCMDFYHRQISGLMGRSARSEEVLEWLYHYLYLTDAPFLRTAFFQSATPTSNYFEMLNDHNFDEAEAYWQTRRQQIKENADSLVDFESGRQYPLEDSAEYQRKNLELLDLRQLRDASPESVSLLRKQDGRIIGMTVVVPIEAKTMAYLECEPLSGAYLRHISPSARSRFARTGDAPAGWFIRILDCEASDSSARADILLKLLSFIPKGGLWISHAGTSIMHELHTLIGFEAIPDFVHYDLGDRFPIVTYELDLRAEPAKAYLDRLGLRANDSPPQSQPAVYGFSRREHEVFQLLLQGTSNKEICAQLHISEVTVKKHISSILRKTDTKNRAQLLKKVGRAMYG